MFWQGEVKSYGHVRRTQKVVADPTHSDPPAPMQGPQLLRLLPQPSHVAELAANQNYTHTTHTHTHLRPCKGLSCCPCCCSRHPQLCRLQCNRRAGATAAVSAGQDLAVEGEAVVQAHKRVTCSAAGLCVGCVCMQGGQGRPCGFVCAVRCVCVCMCVWPAALRAFAWAACVCKGQLEGQFVCD